MNFHLIPRQFLAKSIGIATALAVIYLTVCTFATGAAQENELSQYLPTEYEIQSLRSGWQLKYIGESLFSWAGGGGDIHVTYGFYLVSINQNKWEEFLEAGVTISKYSSEDESRRDFDRMAGEAPFQGKKGSVSVPLGEESCVAFSGSSTRCNTNGMPQLIFRKSVFLVHVWVSGYSNLEKSTNACTPKSSDAEALAGFVEAKLPLGTKGRADTAVATVGTVVLIGAAAVLVGPLVASGVAEVGLMVGTTGVAEALISLPLVGGLLSRIILSPWAAQMVGLYGQYVDDIVFWACTLPEKLPAAMKAITQNVEKFVQKSSEYAQRYGEARYHDVWGQEDASKWKVPGGRK